eukprot:TRINITY_DN5429_c1_g4_i4.p1 TRINITY_DN5429_c1_g4~~TRINITY_DN5429_c1_g4_i4.p1  ORF type:complete len:245 (+),score=44.27 TRINITY_DN5429_c1_g4_i4:32-736(+)
MGDQPPRFYDPWGVAVDLPRGRLYVTDFSSHSVFGVRLGDGLVESVWGGQDTGEPQLKEPRGLAYCPATDKLYVADHGHDCVKVLRGSDGYCVQVLGTGRGNGRDQMNGPQFVAVDSDRVYISDSCNHRVLVYAKQTGAFLFQMGEGQEGSGDNQFGNPCGVSVDREAGLLYVADSWNHRVCVYRSGDGSHVSRFPVLRTDDSEATPVGVLWDAASRVLYVTLTSSTTMCVYNN